MIVLSLAHALANMTTTESAQSVVKGSLLVVDGTVSHIADDMTRAAARTLAVAAQENYGRGQNCALWTKSPGVDQQLMALRRSPE